MTTLLLSHRVSLWKSLDFQTLSLLIWNWRANTYKPEKISEHSTCNDRLRKGTDDDASSCSLAFSFSPSGLGKKSTMERWWCFSYSYKRQHNTQKHYLIVAKDTCLLKAITQTSSTPSPVGLQSLTTSFFHFPNSQAESLILRGTDHGTFFTNLNIPK